MTIFSELPDPNVISLSVGKFWSHAENTGFYKTFGI